MTRYGLSILSNQPLASHVDNGDCGVLWFGKKMIKRIAAILGIGVACGCQHAPPATVINAGQTLTGVVIRKDWTKSTESWNAGGSEYYVLDVEGAALPPGGQSAKEGIILRPSDSVPFERFANFVGRRVTCRGDFVAGEPYIPPKDSVDQMPASLDPITGKTEHPIVGAGFRVRDIKPVGEK